MKNYANKKIFVEKLLTWWKKHKRNFPWRETNDPYKIFVAEVLLKKTTSSQVKQIYSQFVETFPTVKDLYTADKEKIIKIIRPLGMYKQRTGQLKSAAEYIIKNFSGKFPTEKQELLEIPGIGEYTANAILSFSAGSLEPLLDRNFIRVIERVFCLKTTKKRAKEDKNFWKFAKSLVEQSGTPYFNYAVLDFAAIICKAKNPKCQICPAKEICCYYSTIDKNKIVYK